MITSMRPLARIVAVVVMFAIVLQCVPVYAQSYDPDDELPTPTVLERRVTKLGRGLTNVAFGWAEIPLTWDRKMKQGRPLTYLIGVAPLLGITKMGMRMGVGVYEVATFYTTRPEQRYEPIIEPAYLF